MLSRRFQHAKADRYYNSVDTREHAHLPCGIYALARPSGVGWIGEFFLRRWYISSRWWQIRWYCSSNRYERTNVSVVERELRANYHTLLLPILVVYYYRSSLCIKICNLIPEWFSIAALYGRVKIHLIHMNDARLNIRTHLVILRGQAVTNLCAFDPSMICARSPTPITDGMRSNTPRTIVGNVSRI